MNNENIDQRMEELFEIIEAEFVKIEYIFTKLENRKQKDKMESFKISACKI